MNISGTVNALIFLWIDCHTCLWFNF